MKSHNQRTAYNAEYSYHLRAGFHVSAKENSALLEKLTDSYCLKFFGLLYSNISLFVC